MKKKFTFYSSSFAARQAVMVLPRTLPRNIGHFPHRPSQALVNLYTFVYTISHEASHPSFENFLRTVECLPRQHPTQTASQALRGIPLWLMERLLA